MKMCFAIQIGRAACAILDLFEDKDMHPYPNALCITRINVPRTFRGQGYGSRLLKDALYAADAEGVTLVLQVCSSGPMTDEELEHWYMRHGFVKERYFMVRQPQPFQQRGNDGQALYGQDRPQEFRGPAREETHDART